MKRKVSAFLLAAFLLVSFTGSASAQSNSGSGLQISPVRSSLVIAPGTSKVTTFNIKNVTSGDIETSTVIEDFTPDITGATKIVTDNKESSVSIKSFVGTIAALKLTPGESKNVDVKVAIPATASAGAYYGVVRFQANPLVNGQKVSGTSVAMTASVGAVVLVQVPGEITEKMQLNGVTAMYKGKPSNLFAYAPDEVRVEINNTGNSILQPFGTVKVTDFRGKEVYSYQLNSTDPKADVLPKSPRYFINKIKGVSKPGRYKIVTSLSYGTGGDVISSQTSFWLIPIWVAVVALVLLVALVGLVLLVRRKTRRPIKRR